MFNTNSKKLKFIIFLPNTNEAENPLPLVPLLVNDMNTWFPVDNIGGGRLFPVNIA